MRARLKRIIEFRIFQGEKQHVAECLDFHVVTEAFTLDDLATNIQEAIALHLEGEDLAEAGFTENPRIVAVLELPFSGQVRSFNCGEF